MRTKHMLITLLTAFALVMASGAACYADSYNFKGSCEYNGSEITSTFTSTEFAATQANMEPGDRVDYAITYKNNDNRTTSWYMRNSVLETLEESKDVAENGGYTYVLKNIGPDGTETVLFDNSEVGGENKTDGLEGLKQATNATGEYFFIQNLRAGESGKTLLTVEFEGETEVNDYMDTEGSLMVSYAVEPETPGTPGTDTPGTPVTSNPQTGDTAGLLKFVLLMTAAVIAAILAIVSWRRDRKDGDEA